MEWQVDGRLKRANYVGYRYGYAMDVDSSIVKVELDLDRVREEIALIQDLEVEHHGEAFERIHTVLAEALRSIDGK